MDGRMRRVSATLGARGGPLVTGRRWQSQVGGRVLIYCALGYAMVISALFVGGVIYTPSGYIRVATEQPPLAPVMSEQRKSG